MTRQDVVWVANHFNIVVIKRVQMISRSYIATLQTYTQYKAYSDVTLAYNIDGDVIKT